MSETLRGAVAMFDALGFKGVWRRHEPREVVRRLKELQGLATQIEDLFQGIEERLGLGPSFFSGARVSLISDTVVMGVGAGRSEDHGVPQRVLDLASMAMLTTCVAKFTFEAGRGDPLFVYRGAISFGDFAVDDRFVVGEAIDDAAEHMDMASAAVVWLTPRALDVFDGDPALQAGCEVLPFDVPITGGERIASQVVSPLRPATKDDDVDAWAERVLRSFHVPSARVRVLRQNTESFLKRAVADHFAMLSEK